MAVIFASRAILSRSIADYISKTRLPQTPGSPAVLARKASRENALASSAATRGLNRCAPALRRTDFSH